MTARLDPRGRVLSFRPFRFPSKGAAPSAELLHGPRDDQNREQASGLRIPFALAFLLAGCGQEPKTVPAVEVTWNHDIAPLIHGHCMPCHGEEGAAPFPLVSAHDVTKRRRQILEVLGNGFMPPWLPDEEGPKFRGERGLSKHELDTLKHWLEGGAPLGAGSEVQPPAIDPWPLGDPDRILEVDGRVQIPAEGDGVLHTLVLPLGFEEARELRAVQFAPSTPRALHGAGWLFDTSDYPARADADYPGPGFREMGGVGMNTIGSLGAWSPGRSAIALLPGFGFPLEGQGHLLVQLHLNGTGKVEHEHSRVGLYFNAEPGARPVMDLIMGSLCVDIPAGERDYVIRDEMTLNADAELLGLYPKARYLCSWLRVSALFEDGQSRTLLSISDYDFNWVESFWYEEPQSLPAGTRIRLEFHYNNTASNLRNPHHPPQRVQLGRDGDDEMAFLMLYLSPREERELPDLEALHREGFQKRNRDLKAWRVGR